MVGVLLLKIGGVGMQENTASIANISENEAPIADAAAIFDSLTPIDDTPADSQLPQENQYSDQSSDTANSQNPTDNPEDLTVDASIYTYEKLVRQIRKQPLNREIMYQILVFCTEENSEPDLLEKVAKVPESKTATLDGFSLITQLVNAGGLDVKEYDENGLLLSGDPENRPNSKSIDAEAQDSIDAEAQDSTNAEAQVSTNAEELESENAEEQVAKSRGYLVSDLGKRYIDENSPDQRLVQLFKASESRNQAYTNVLKFLNTEKKTYKALEMLLVDDSALLSEAQVFGIDIKPSVFIDRLERAGGIVWDDGWTITKAGRRMLEVLSKS